MISLLRNLEVEQRSQEWAAEHCFSISLVSQVQQDALYQAGLLVPLDVPVARKRRRSAGSAERLSKDEKGAGAGTVQEHSLP